LYSDFQLYTYYSMSHLFQSLRIKELTLKNRIVVSPMCQYSAEDGFANDWHLVHLGSRAVGGAGLIITEATAISPEGRISPFDLGIWKDEHVEGLLRITKFIHKQGAKAGIQLAHAGRKASMTQPWLGGKLVSPAEGGWEPIAPSAIAFNDAYAVPHELSVQEIKTVIDNFTSAANRALHAGFDVIELHGAHGYLIHEFLSPLSNHRKDSYGRSFENRVRLLLEIVESVSGVWPKSHPLFVRISATDWTDGGWSQEDSVRLAALLKSKGVDLVDCSTAGNVHGAKIPVGPGYQVPFAQVIRQQTGILTGAVGLITEVQQAESILADGKADLVVMAREMLRDPYFALHAATELKEDVAWPVQYERAKRSV
jgi:2,4-dienoyl-CoA reductase-like NADH-dependent reductase (Old Yellow Enzyme family)